MICPTENGFFFLSYFAAWMMSFAIYYSKDNNNLKGWPNQSEKYNNNNNNNNNNVHWHRSHQLCMD